MIDSCVYNDEEFGIVSGSSAILEFDLQDLYGNALENVSLTKATWRMAKYGEYDTLVEKTTSSGISILGNVIQVTLNQADTENRNGLFHHQLILVDKNSKQFVISQGKIIITRMIK